VDLVTAEVSVLDKDGNPVRNLKRDYFELYEDGKRQDILSLDEVQADAKQSSLGASPLDEVAPPRGKFVLMLFTYPLFIRGWTIGCSRRRAGKGKKRA
jgi:hypothetical protein